MYDKYLFPQRVTEKSSDQIFYPKPCGSPLAKKNCIFNKCVKFIFPNTICFLATSPTKNLTLCFDVLKKCFDIVSFCLFQCIEHYSLGNHQICESGKFNMMDDLLPTMKENDDRVLIFTQFTMVMDIMEQYLRIRGHKYLRLDGSTPVQERLAALHQFQINFSGY
jgi:SNF2 family DNA or RNA helicase